MQFKSQVKLAFEAFNNPTNSESNYQRAIQLLQKQKNETFSLDEATVNLFLSGWMNWFSTEDANDDLLIELIKTILPLLNKESQSLVLQKLWQDTIAGDHPNFRKADFIHAFILLIQEVKQDHPTGPDGDPWIFTFYQSVLKEAGNNRLQLACWKWIQNASENELVGIKTNRNMLHETTKHGDRGLTDPILQKNPASFLDAMGEDGTPLHCCGLHASLSNPYIIRSLVMAGADVRKKNQQGLTPLETYLQADRFDEAKALILAAWEQNKDPFDEDPAAQRGQKNRIVNLYLASIPKSLLSEEIPNSEQTREASTSRFIRRLIESDPTFLTLKSGGERDQKSALQLAFEKRVWFVVWMFVQTNHQLSLQYEGGKTQIVNSQTHNCVLELPEKLGTTLSVQEAVFQYSQQSIARYLERELSPESIPDELHILFYSFYLSKETYGPDWFKAFSIKWDAFKKDTGDIGDFCKFLNTFKDQAYLGPQEASSNLLSLYLIDQEPIVNELIGLLNVSKFNEYHLRLSNLTSPLNVNWRMLFGGTLFGLTLRFYLADEDQRPLLSKCLKMMLVKGLNPSLFEKKEYIKFLKDNPDAEFWTDFFEFARDFIPLEKRKEFIESYFTSTISITAQNFLTLSKIPELLFFHLLSKEERTSFRTKDGECAIITLKKHGGCFSLVKRMVREGSGDILARDAQGKSIVYFPEEYVKSKKYGIDRRENLFELFPEDVKFLKLFIEKGGDLQKETCNENGFAFLQEEFYAFLQGPLYIYKHIDFRSHFLQWKALGIKFSYKDLYSILSKLKIYNNRSRDLFFGMLEILKSDLLLCFLQAVPLSPPEDNPLMLIENCGESLLHYAFNAVGRSGVVGRCGKPLIWGYYFGPFLSILWSIPDGRPLKVDDKINDLRGEHPFLNDLIQENTDGEKFFLTRQEILNSPNRKKILKIFLENLGSSFYPLLYRYHYTQSTEPLSLESYAAKVGDFELIKIFGGIRKSKSDIYGYWNRLEISARTTPSSPRSYAFPSSKDQYTNPLHVLNTTIAGWELVLKKLVKNHPELLTQTDVEGLTPLERHSKEGNLGLIKKLIELHPNQLTIEMVKKATSIAARYGHGDIIEFLVLHYGQELLISQLPEGEGVEPKTQVPDPLIEAAYYGQEKTVLKILTITQKSPIDPKGGYPHFYWDYLFNNDPDLSKEVWETTLKKNGLNRALKQFNRLYSPFSSPVNTLIDEIWREIFSWISKDEKKGQQAFYHLLLSSKKFALLIEQDDQVQRTYGFRVPETLIAKNLSRFEEE